MPIVADSGVGRERETAELWSKLPEISKLSPRFYRSQIAYCVLYYRVEAFRTTKSTPDASPPQFAAAAAG